jgi:2-polyprenyl-3-methyl-5-hydroxy-6-metoxy-1,4-benzoquinol methylase
MKSDEKTNEEKEHYEEHPYPNSCIMSKKQLQKYRWVFNVLPKPIERGSKILDAGCGTGELSCFLSGYGAVVGMDFSKNAIKLANALKERLKIKNVSFVAGDITGTSRRGKYDYVFSIGVLHHIPKVDEAVESLKSCMAEGGFLVVSVYDRHSMPSFLFWSRFFKKTFTETEIADRFHNPYRVFYTKEQMAELMRSHGLKIIKTWRNMPKAIRMITGINPMMTFCCKKDGSDGHVSAGRTR